MESLFSMVLIGLVLWALVRYYGQRPKTFDEIMVDMAAAVEDAQRVIGLHLLPAIQLAVVAFADFEAALKSADEAMSQ